MMALTILDVERPWQDFDTVIIWLREETGDLIAYAYQNGNVQRTTPLAARGIGDAVEELKSAWAITVEHLRSVR